MTDQEPDPITQAHDRQPCDLSSSPHHDHISNPHNDESLSDLPSSSLHVNNPSDLSPHDLQDSESFLPPRNLPLNADCLNILLTYLHVTDLLPLLQVCRSWREMALYRLNSITSLNMTQINSRLNCGRLKLCQSGVERLLRLCSGKLQRLDLRVSSSNKIYNDLERLFRAVGECENLEELLFNYPQGTKNFSHQSISLPKSLKRLHITGNLQEEIFSAMMKDVSELSSVTIGNNIFVNGHSLVENVSSNGLKNLSLHRCSNFSPEILHTLLRLSAATLETVSITGFPDAQLLNFDKSDIRSLDCLRDLIIGSWYARDGFKFSYVYPLLEKTRNLTSLSLRHCYNLDEDPTKLMSLPQLCPRLQTLDLTGCVIISAANLTPLAKLSHLSKLVLNHIKILTQEDTFDFDLLVSEVILKLRSLEVLYLEDPTRQTLRDEHVIRMISSDQISLRKISLNFASAIDGRFIEQCSKMSRERSIDVSLNLQKGSQRGDDLFRKVFCGPSFLNVFVSWED